MPEREVPFYELVERMAADFAVEVVGILRESTLEELTALLAEPGPPADGAAASPTDETGDRPPV